MPTLACCTRNTLLTAAAVAVAASFGCAGGDAPQDAVPPRPVNRPPPPAAAAPKPAANNAAKKTQDYSPPYPDRENLFFPPQRATPVARRAGRSGDEAVELLGFTSVDQPKAVLSIDGVVASLATGGTKYGVQVVSIEPPKAVLQRGRTRWTASLD